MRDCQLTPRDAEGADARGLAGSETGLDIRRGAIQSARLHLSEKVVARSATSGLSAKGQPIDVDAGLPLLVQPASLLETMRATALPGASMSVVRIAGPLSSSLRAPARSSCQ
jgi:hypothetical protein